MGGMGGKQLESETYQEGSWDDGLLARCDAKDATAA